MHLLCDHEHIKFSGPRFPNWFRNFSIIWQEGTALNYSMSERLLISIAMEICIGVTYRMVPVNLLFYTSTPRIISKLFSHTTNLGKEEKENNPLVFPQTLLQLSNKPVRFYPVSLQKGHCLTLKELRDSKQLNQTKADMTITQANMLTDYWIVCPAWTVSRKWGITMHCTGFLFCFAF